ncbi:histidine triad nucleotide-binding protein [Motilibacter aurantiacus]|uniref:histidine triad nucleotide-binding protein n=1 Tax=Motilibacter aurantiacus TaxID=2714955 RepID=UPI00140AD7F6|nr:histidine triad nucleotide-binding protein [Motilibacter aurantiacus]NHC45051.1 histidine triad nucleotide-binding protein [Motilibacter aurantiacus]
MAASPGSPPEPPSPSPDCLFCRLVAGEIPAERVYEDADVLAFRDVSPQAPTHVLVIPRVHVADVGELAGQAPELVAAVLRGVREVAAREGAASYRLVFNTGPDAGQSVPHVHGHVLAGRRLTWPPG